MNDQLLPRRRKAAASRETERGLIMQIMFHSPKDTLAGAVALTAVLAIIVNAVFLQAGRHPSPLFGDRAAGSQEPLCRASGRAEGRTVVVAPAQQTAAPPQATTESDAASASGRSRGPARRSAGQSRALDQRPGRAAPRRAPRRGRTARPIPAAIPQSAASTKADPPANPILSSARVAAVQRALTDYGYGQIKATGTVGADTQAAIQKFERERKLPLTGQVSERLVRELGLATGRTLRVACGTSRRFA